MNRTDRAHLEGERGFLKRELPEIPETAWATRMSLESRLREVEAELAAHPVDEREPARVQLTFKGRPVVGTHGIVADFGAVSVQRFTDAIAAMASRCRLAAGSGVLISHGLETRIGLLYQSSTASRASAITAPTPSTSALKSVRATMSRVSSMKSWWMSRSSPTDHSARARSVRSTMTAAYSARRSRWKAGLISRRCRFQKSPSLVSSPSPSTRFRSPSGRRDSARL